jgi:hypothetical protein
MLQMMLLNELIVHHCFEIFAFKSERLKDVWNEWACILLRQRMRHADALRSCRARRVSTSASAHSLRLSRSSRECLCRRWSLLRWRRFASWCISLLDSHYKRRKKLTTFKIFKERLLRCKCDRWCDSSTWQWCIASRKNFLLRSDKCFLCDVFSDCAAVSEGVTTHNTEECESRVLMIEQSQR